MVSFRFAHNDPVEGTTVMHLYHGSDSELGACVTYCHVNLVTISLGQGH